MRFESVRIPLGTLVVVLFAAASVSTMIGAFTLAVILFFCSLLTYAFGIVIFVARPRWAVSVIEIADDLLIDGNHVPWENVRAVEKRGWIYGTRWLDLITPDAKHLLVRCSDVIVFPSPYETVSAETFQAVKDAIGSHVAIVVRTF